MKNKDTQKDKDMMWRVISIISNIPKLIFMWITFPFVAIIMFFVTNWDIKYERNEYKREAIKWLKGKIK